MTLKDALKIDLNAVTEDDNIQFTENTVRESEIIMGGERVELIGINRTTAARKIQRAWRNYQTLKVVRKYYDYYRGLFSKEKQRKEKEESGKKEETVRKSGLRTLRIRKEERTSPKTTLKIGRHGRGLDLSEEADSRITKEIMK